MRFALALLALPAFALGCSSSSPDLCDGAANCFSLSSGAATKDVEDAFALVTANGTIIFGEGTFNMQKTLNLAASGVTVKGAGIDKTTLNFGTQTAGEDGILVTGDHFTIQDLRVLDAKGNGIKVTGTVSKFVKGVIFRRVSGEWTAAASAQNGKYAIYPVLAEDVLMEDCVAKGSSDAGIYVGQSKNIIVRRNKASGNVAGLEIENSIGADVYGNEVEGNSGGILIFGLPDLVQNTAKVRVFDNIAKTNNVNNFAGGGVVQKIPAGTGVLVMSSSEVEVFGNTVTGNDAVGIAVVSYCVADTPYCDDAGMGGKILDPFPRKIYIHDNTINGNGTNNAAHLTTAGGDLSQLSLVLKNTFGTMVPQMIYDGVFAPPRGVAPADWKPTSATNPMELCLSNNGSADFTNFDANAFDSVTLTFANGTKPENRNAATFTCTPTLGLTPIQIAGVDSSSK